MGKKDIMEIVPKAYKPDKDTAKISFKNFYIEYGRFHMDKT